MPTMNVSLTDEMAKFVEGEVASGDYMSASEVVRDALRLMRHDRSAEDAKLTLLRQEVDKGWDDAESGRLSSLSIEDIANDILSED